MFREANNIARNFTRPVVLSRRRGDDVCSAGIGTCIAVNRDGWIITALHIVKQFQGLQAQCSSLANAEAQLESVRADNTLSKADRKRQVGSIKWPNKDAQTKACSAWWGVEGATAREVFVLEAVDLAAVRLEPFDPSQFPQFPVFKDPARDFEPGVSLCKLGFPLHAVTPIWNEERKGFEIPNLIASIPVFPIEGIMTRIINFNPPPGVEAVPFPMQFVETSTPGLRGQSGGPTFDKNGTIWAMQVQTAHYDLGFEGLGRNQTLNVGRGVSTATLLPFFDANGIAYEKSDY